MMETYLKLITSTCDVMLWQHRKPREVEVRLLTLVNTACENTFMVPRDTHGQIRWASSPALIDLGSWRHHPSSRRWSRCRRPAEIIRGCKTVFPQHKQRSVYKRLHRVYLFCVWGRRTTTSGNYKQQLESALGSGGLYNSITHCFFFHFTNSHMQINVN